VILCGCDVRSAIRWASESGSGPAYVPQVAVVWSLSCVVSVVPHMRIKHQLPIRKAGDADSGRE
jgi:hypothetical protein